MFALIKSIVLNKDAKANEEATKTLVKEMDKNFPKTHFKGDPSI